jgi:hypothetical protein
LKITVTQNIPSQGPTSVTYTVGRVYLSTSDTPGFAPVTGNSSANTGNTGTGTSTNPSSLAPVDNSGTGSLAIPSTGTGGTAGAQTSSPTTGSVAEQPTYAQERGPSAWSFYLVLILAALSALLGSQAVRYFSVRLALSSQRIT